MTFLRSTPAVLALVLATVSAGAVMTQAAWAQDAAAPEAGATAEAPAAAMPAAQDPAAAYASARNQLGVLGYCQEQGHIDGKAVEIQAKLIALIPPGDTAAGDAAEAAGKEGKIQAMGVDTSIADAATQQNTTEADLCKQMDTMIQQIGAQLPS